jgi:hypothetical protein
MTNEAKGPETRDRDDPTLLAEQAREQIQKLASELRSANVPRETEPPATYRP